MACSARILVTAWCFFVGISVSVPGWQELVYGLPPPCESHIYCTGDLLKQVQLGRLFSDDKHFVDMPLRESPELVLKKFQQLVNVTPGGILSKEQLQQFVSSSFNDPGQEFEQWEPQDWTSSPQILAKISDQKLQAWASDLNAKWKSLGRKIKDDVRTHPMFYSQIYVPHPVIVPGGRFIEYYYWDSYWVIEGLLLSEMAATAKGMIQNFLYLVERYGHIPNGGRVYYLCRSQPPFLTLMMDAYLVHANDTEFLRENIHLLEVEYEFWQRNRSVSITVGDRNHTLNYYNVQIGEPRPESYSKDWELASDLNEDARQELWAELKSAAESGWDFSSRWFLSWPPPLPATLKDTKARAVVPVDLNAFLCKTEHLLASFYRILGNTTKAAQFQAALECRLEAVQAVLWNEAAGVWLDFNLLKKQPNPAFYPSNLAPLWTDCFSDQAAAERAVRYLEGSTVLSYKNGLPTSLFRTGEQWDLPNAWPPLQHMVIAGLAKSSSSRAKEIAFDLAQNWVRTNFALYKKYQAMFEKYNVDGDGKPGTGGEYQVQEGFGWTNGVVLQLLDLYGDRLTSGSPSTLFRAWIVAACLIVLDLKW
ncbi:trehalase isoform X1 [Chelonoidis abingdonii]|uniref:Trehalase n=2 Tax=Chelonoidis abingdonii TaxID=106734 RepID=A0A8C0G8X9_CHEAB|nr:trehalase isoform X1 [Chelonoidis abingdonii]